MYKCMVTVVVLKSAGKAMECVYFNRVRNVSVKIKRVVGRHPLLVIPESSERLLCDCQFCVLITVFVDIIKTNSKLG